MSTVKLACDVFRGGTTPRDREEIRNFAMKCAQKSITYSKIGRNAAFANLVREMGDRLL